MEQIEIKDTSTFVRYVSEIGSQIKRKQFFYNWELLYRGQSNVSYEIIPSIARDYNGKTSPLLHHERELIESVMVQFPDMFKVEYEPVEVLALLQHFGMPTRLLDVTENALVGLYFACLGDAKNDGEVFVFKQDETNIRVKYLTEAIADSYRFIDSESAYLETFFGQIKDQPYYLEAKHMTELSQSSTKDGANWLKHYAISPIFIQARIHSMRQRMQAGRYIIFPNTIAYEDEQDVFLREIAPIPKNHESIVGRAIVKGNAKQKILQELAALGISKRTLFPDNIDIVCDEIKNAFLRL